MGRGKIEIKMIENPTNRQVTYSKRRNGIFKKAQELTVLCDAKVSIIMFSKTGKCHEFLSPSITTKAVYDKYQNALGIDLWSTHYERMLQNLERLKEANYNLRRQIRQRMGQDLNDVTYEELRELETSMEPALANIRDRKYHVIKTQTETCKKKVRSLEERHGHLLHEFEAKCRFEENEVEYGPTLAMANAAPYSNLLAISLHTNFHHG